MAQQWQASQGQQELQVIMNGWYSASQEIVFGAGTRGGQGGSFRQSASSGNLTDRADSRPL